MSHSTTHWPQDCPGARQSTDQKPQLHHCTAQQPPSVTSRRFSLFPNISWAAMGQPKLCLLLAKSHWQNQELNQDKPHLQRDTRRRRTTSLPHLQPGSAGEGESSAFTQTLRALDTEEM